MVLSDLKHSKCGQTEHRTTDVRPNDGHQGVAHVAPGTVLLGMCDGNVPPHGQGDCQEDGDRVPSLGEEGVEVDNDGPRVRELLLVAVILVQVRVDAEGDVVDHDQQIGDGESGENSICGGTHVPTSEHSNVQAIGDDTEGAHEDTDVTVDVEVPGGEMVEERILVISEGIAWLWLISQVDDEACLQELSLGLSNAGCGG